MVTRILVAIDRSETSQAAFTQALDLAKSTQATLMLLHVIAPNDEEIPATPPLPVPHFYPVVTEEILQQYQATWKLAEQRGLQTLRILASQAATAGVKAECQMHLGDPGRTICAIAQDWGADLIMMGHRGYRGLSEWVLGSVSNYVLHHAPCSVLTVQPSRVRNTVRKGQN